jgi:CMP-N-acetylneuraminic acid synthetase
MSTIAFIPARCGSKSIPFKNIKDFCGKPLIYWNLKALQDCAGVDEIYLATDCDRIALVAQEMNFSKVKVYRRNAENAEDTSSTESVILEFLNQGNFKNSDVFILSQATSPLTQTVDYAAALKQYYIGEYDSLLTCVRVKKFFWNADGTPLNYDYMNRPRRQDFNGILLENGAFYINTVHNIMQSKNRLSGTIGIYEMPEHVLLDIDEPDDWALGEKLMLKYILNPEIEKSVK